MLDFFVSLSNSKSSLLVILKFFFSPFINLVLLKLFIKEKSSSMYLSLFFLCKFKICLTLKHCGVCVKKKLFLFKFINSFFFFFLKHLVFLKLELLRDFFEIR